MRSAVILILSTLLVPPAIASAHEADESSVNEALLTEIRLLREDLQRVMAWNLRASLLIERIRIQSETVRELGRDVAQRKMSRRYQEMEREAGWEEQYEEQLERRLASATPDQREEIEREMEMVSRRAELERRRRIEEEALTLEMEKRLDGERARLDGLFDEIAAIERRLD